MCVFANLPCLSVCKMLVKGETCFRAKLNFSFYIWLQVGDSFIQILFINTLHEARTSCILGKKCKCLSAVHASLGDGGYTICTLRKYILAL